MGLSSIKFKFVTFLIKTS